MTMRSIAEFARSVRLAVVDPELVRGAIALAPPDRLAGLPEDERIIEAEATACFLAQRYAPDSVEERRYWWTMSVMRLGRHFARVGRCMNHVLRPAACGLVADTELRDLPMEPPRLLRGPWSLEAARGALFGETAQLAGYVDSFGIRLIGVFLDGGVAALTWQPEWGEKFSLKTPPAHAEESKNPQAALEWGGAAARFLVTVAILLDAEGTPFEPRDEAKNSAGRDARKSERKAAEWITRHVYLNQARAQVREGSVEVRPAITTGLVPERVQVRGHLRLQACGPRRSERKWVYVAPFAATRWVRAADVRVVTHAKEG